VPEGDTVFITAQRLHAVLAGRAITHFDLRVPSLALARAEGESVREVVPVGKHILMRLSGGRTLHSHLKMDGSWRLSATGQPPRTRPDHEIRAIVGNCEHVAFGYRVHDLALVSTKDEHRLIGHLGPDLLADEFDLAESMRRFAESARLPIGEALLDQRLVAGIGNVYKCELLFLHRANPWRPVSETANLDALLLDAARLLRANCGRLNRSTTGWTQPGHQYYVYARRDKGCMRCGARIVQDDQGPPGDRRVLYYCPSCQGGNQNG
jgi:endonuclease VIII